MTAPTLKLQYGAPLRRTPSRPGPSPAPPTPGAAGQVAPTADILRLGRAHPSGASAAAQPVVALCVDHEPEPGVAHVPPAPSSDVRLKPDVEAPEAKREPSTPPPPSPVSAAPRLEPEPHQLAAFAVTLEAIDAPAFLTKPGGEIAHANGAARAWLERDRAGAVASLNDARCSPKSHAFLTAPVPTSPGAEPWRLVVMHPQQDRDAERMARVAAAASRWALSARQREVLSLVVEGLSVPTIAAVLGCVEKTVGSHLNAIFKKALVESRAELTAKVWMG